jgi:magnesium transporter
VKTLQLYLSDIKELLQNREFISARTCLKEISPIDLADGWEHFDADERKALFRLLSRQRAVQLFEELEPAQQVELVNSLQAQDAQELLQDLDPSETGRMVRGLPPPMIRQLTGIMKKGGQESVRKFLQYPPQTVGALMRGRYVTLDPHWTAKQALERVQLSTRLRRIEETFLDTLMALDDQERLVGVVGLKVLVVAPRDMTVGELMERAPVTLKPEADQEEAVSVFNRYKHKGIPVVGPDRRMLGVVVYRDIVQVASEEVEEDFAKMAGTTAGISRSAFETARDRLPWLIATCLGGLMVSAIIRYFEPTLSKIVALATFIPLIAGMGGNVGSQTATVMVRAIATGEVKLGRSRAVVTKEMASGAMLGLFYALGVAAVSFAIYGAQYGWRFPVVVSTAMLVSMFAAATLGAIQPLIFKRMGIDPATATAPFITTATDLLSNIVYFSLATYLLL